MTAAQFYKYVAERGGVPQSFARQWTELIFTCLREVAISEEYFRVGKLCEFKHRIRKARVTRSPLSGEYCMAPDRDEMVVKILPCAKRDFDLGIKNGTVNSMVGGYKPSRPLTREECEERGYKTGFVVATPARMKALGYDLNCERMQNFIKGQVALGREQKAAKAAEENKL